MRLTGEVENAQGRLEALRLANTDGHPEVVNARKQLQILQGQLVRAVAKVPAPSAPPSIIPRGAPSPEPPSGESETARLRADRDAILAGIEKVNVNMRELPRVRGQLGELERERKRVTEALDTEVRKLAEAETNYNVVAANKGDTFKVQDPANLPQQPDSPKKGLLLVAAAVLGLLIALAVALALVYLDPTAYNEYELSRVTDLPVLVSIGRYDITQATPSNDKGELRAQFPPSRTGPRTRDGGRHGG